MSGGLTPRGEESLVRLSTWMPYEAAREVLEDLLGMRVSKATARRATLSTGQAALTVWEAEVERLQQETPPVPTRAEKQAMSADGAMVHLVGGEWDARQNPGDWRGDAHRCRRSPHRAALLLLTSR